MTSRILEKVAANAAPTVEKEKSSVTTEYSTTERITEQRDALMDQMIRSLSGAFNIFTVYLGDRLGLYRALSSGAGFTSSELAQRTGTQERYVREWLEQQAVAGILHVDNADAPTEHRLFRLPAGHAEVLADPDSPNYLAPLAQVMNGAVRPIDELVQAFRDGGGVPYRAYGADMREGQASINRVMFLQDIGARWIPAMPDVHARMLSNPPARVADIGCGAGWSCIGIAQSYPRVFVDGFDLDEPSVEMAQTNVREAGLSGRVRVEARDAGDPSLAGTYDLVTAFECVHDMSDPVSVLRSMRRLAGDTGAVLVVDERVGDRFMPEGNDVDWMMYGWSVLHCLPVGMADHPAAGTGTVMRPDTLRQYALEAGFRDVEILPVDNYFFRLYRLIP